MAFEMKDIPQTLRVYNWRTDTREFIGASDAYLPPHTGLPACCTETAPPEIPAGQVALFDEKAGTWSLTEDHRGETVYDTATGVARYIDAPGALSPDTVSTAPSGPFMKWDGQSWMKDEAAEKAAQVADAVARRDTLLAAAREIIGEWQSELLLGSLGDADKASLKEWLDYIRLLKQVNTDNAPDITWPQQPA
ncbi:Phage tail fiber assembly protein [Kosakonia radicincitans]|uniref:tail fiber assembly protein n=1 Tax=Kosakonia radicincitans TaxID=283686 RepID=UPI001183B12A|nr:tail fiber assembly protein [Kosakonia radicincitans]VVT53878.1 Phage tail fiber assembly protein [Kosakonia radicincitans]